MKGIILAGGKGTRLLPLTAITNKHLLPVYNKPMVLYPLETLKSLGINEILLVAGGEHIGAFADFLGDGSKYGVKLTYKVQQEAGGIAQALSLAEDFASGEEISVILGDNIFEHIEKGTQIVSTVDKKQASLFIKKVLNPNRFGVPIFDAGKIVDIEEKPKNPKSEFAVTGFYKYPVDVFEIIKTLKPSQRGELEITDVNRYYVRAGRCAVYEVSGFWSDAGTPDSLLSAAQWAANYGK